MERQQFLFDQQPDHEASVDLGQHLRTRERYWDERALQHRAMRVGMRRHVPVVSYRGSTALFHNTVDLAGDAADKSSRIHPRLSDDLLGFA